MPSVVIFSDDTELRDLVRQIDGYQVLYLSTELVLDNLPNTIDLAIFDFDVVPLSLLDEWAQFPRLHIPKMGVVSVENLHVLDEVLERLDNYVVRPFSASLFQFRLNQIFHGKVLNEYVGTLRSELKNPLTSIIGYSTLMLKQFDNLSREQTTTFLGHFPVQVKRILYVIDLFSDWFKIEWNKKYDFYETDFSHIIQWAQDGTKEQFVEKSQKLVIQAPQNLIPVYVDAGYIAFVISSLLINASMYSAEKTEIEVSCTIQNFTVVCMVKDSGVGISHNSLSQIFKETLRGDDPVIYSQYGLGLSLYICKQIIEMHGGKIWFEDNPAGVGTIFY